VDAGPSGCRGTSGAGAKDERGASKGVSNGETGSHNGADTLLLGCQGCDGDSLAFQHVGGGDEPPLHPIATARAVVAAENPAVHKGFGGVKLETYDGTTCLETFLAAVRNFSIYYKWNEEDELFHSKASLRGPAGQVL